MQITILGSGNIGGSIGQKWAASGHQVVFGVRDIQSDKVANLLSVIEGEAQVVPLQGAIADADVVLFAIPGSAVADTAAMLGGKLDGKIIIDATNQVGAPVMNSLETLQAHAPHAKLYRAFNNLGWENFAEPMIDGQQVDLFYCGDDGDSRSVVDQLISEVGLRPVWIGGINQASVIDELTYLYFALAVQQGYGRHLAFKMLNE